MSAKSNVVEQQALPLADVADIVSGYGFPKEMQGKVVGELPFFKVGDISAAWNSGQKKLTQAQHYLNSVEARAIKAKPFPKGTVVFAKIGEAIKLNRRVILGQPSIVDNNVMGLIPKEGMVDQNYLFYWSLMLRLGDISQATTVPSVRKADVEQLSFPWVPLEQQKRIVAEIEKQFSHLDEAVANLKRVKANLKRYKAAVLKAAVEGRLVETEAELARREGRSFETGAQLLQRILETHRSQWKGKGKYKEPAAPDTTDLPELPEGWLWANWEQIGFSQNGRPFPSKDYCDQGAKLLRPGNLHESGVLTWTVENTRYMPVQYEEENADLIVRGGELVMNLTAQSLKDEFLGRVCLTAENEHCLLNQRLARLTPVESLPEFAFVVFKSKWFRRFVDGFNTGSLIQHMFTSQLATFAFPTPPIAEQQRIVAEVDRRLSLLRETEGQVDVNLKRAERLRQSILSQAFAS